MRVLRIFLFLIFLVGLGFHSEAQSLRQLRKKMPVCVGPKKNEKGLTAGFRMGDPYGLTLKYFFPKYVAIEVVGGSSFAGLNARYLRDWFQLDSINDPRSGIYLAYTSHDVNSIYALQGRIMFTHPVHKTRFPNLSYYIGAGVQYMKLDVSYFYTYEVPPDRFTIERLDHTFQNFGPEYMVGTEYDFKGMRLSTFAEINMFAQDMKEPFKLRLMGGMGVRWRL
ncbi:hypothetical protein AB9P05_07740 [Roseivirga sp. BDSF3-8]|uniref:hypothetical protein n=1 Tax=Roseivirga sp. BDSF3-8 TaxID=3241598 RepID=UPI00353219A2